MADDEIFLVKRPLYGLPEAGLLWYLSYSDHHLRNLQMESSTSDRCLLYRENANVGDVIILQVDDSFGFGDDDFLKNEEEKGSNFI